MLRKSFITNAELGLSDPRDEFIEAPNKGMAMGIATGMAKPLTSGRGRRVYSALGVALLTLQLSLSPAEEAAEPGDSPGEASRESPMAGDVAAAIDHLRLLNYQGDAEAVVEYLAPASREWVLRRSRQATRENIQRISDDLHGFAVLATREENNAGLAVLHIVNKADAAADAEAGLLLFYLGRYDDLWHYLPNPMRVNTWYQSVPSDWENDYAALSAWGTDFKATWRDEEEPQQPDADTLLRTWRQEMTPENDQAPESDEAATSD